MTVEADTKQPLSRVLLPCAGALLFFVGLLDDPPERLISDGIPEGGGAVVRLLVVTALALLIANWRMRHLRLSGATD
jgi:hypothetical protein